MFPYPVTSHQPVSSIPKEVSMPQIQSSLKEQLLRDNDEFQKLNQQHHEYDDRLSTLTDKLVLSDDEQREESELKKKKLQLKDRMAAMVRDASQDGAHP